MTTPRIRQRAVLTLAAALAIAALVLSVEQTDLWSSLWDKDLTAPEELLIVATVGAAVTLLTTWLRRRDADARIGKPNGQGNIVKMLEDQGNLLRDQGGRIDTLTKAFLEHAETNSREHNEVRGDVRALTDRVAALEATPPEKPSALAS